MKRIFIYSSMLVLLFSNYATISHAQVNGANPYDEVGAQHNAIMNRFFTEYSKERVVKEQMTQQGLCQYACTIFPASNCDIAKALTIDATARAMQGMAPTEAAAYLASKGLVGSLFTDYVGKIDRSLTQHVGASYAPFHNTIVGIEAQVLADTRLKEDERKALLLTASVTRYSAKFWKDLNEGTTSYASIGQNAVNTSKDSINTIIRADCVGGILGGFLSWWTWDLEIFIKTTATASAVFSIAEAVRKFWNLFIR